MKVIVSVCLCACVCVCLLNPNLVIRMWFIVCSTAVPEAPQLLSSYHPQFFLSLWGTHSVCKSIPCSVTHCAVTMFPRVILKGTMIKKSQQKKRTSPSNYKERFFVLDTQDLKYSERRPGVSVHIFNKHDIFFYWNCNNFQALSLISTQAIT